IAFSARAQTASQTPSTDTAKSESQIPNAGTTNSESQAPSKGTPGADTQFKSTSSSNPAASEANKTSATAQPRKAAVLIVVNKPTQTMTVTVEGRVRYRWPVSTGATHYSTPDGSYTPFRMELMHYSREWDNAGMPHAIFFTQRGHSIHGSDH